MSGTPDLQTRGAQFAGRRVAVIGLAATGLATAKVLRDVGASVTVYDGKPEDTLDAARVAEARELAGVTLRLGVALPDWNQTDLVVPSPGVPRYAPVLTEAAQRSIPILSEIEVAYRLSVAPILAVTGTNGKTTTVALVGAICREAELQTWVAGNIAEDAGVRLPLIQAAVEAPADGVIVAEISSFQLEWVSEFRPRVAAWLNLTPDHLDRHKDMDEYARAKSNIFRAQREGDFSIVNIENFPNEDSLWERTVTVLEETKSEVLFYRTDEYPKLQGDAFLLGDTLYYEDEKFGIRRRRELMKVSEVPLPGLHNISNVLAATLMTLAIGIKPDVIRSAVKNFRGVAHRMEPVRTLNGVRYLNNSMCTNPAAVGASVSAVETPLVAIAGGLHKGGDLSEMATALAIGARYVILIGASKPEIADALQAAGMNSLQIETAETLPDAVERAAQVARPGETVMLVPGCASFDMFTGFEQRGQVFRDAVNALPESDGGGEDA